MVKLRCLPGLVELLLLSKRLPSMLRGKLTRSLSQLRDSFWSLPIPRRFFLCCICQVSRKGSRCRSCLSCILEVWSVSSTEATILLLL